MAGVGRAKGLLRVSTAWLIVGLAAAGLSHAAEMATGEKDKTPTAKDQVAFGIDMARRGLWSEALFRFDQAGELDPNNPSILNNLAVAHEALGLFDRALALYREALELDPANRGLKRNYARFVEFYQSFKPPPEADEGQRAPESPDAGPQKDAEGTDASSSTKDSPP